MKTNEKDTKQGIVPALRFPEFQNARKWVYLEGNKVFEQISNRKHNSNLPILAISQEHSAIPRDLIDYKVIVSNEGIENYKVVEIGDFIISLRSFQGGIEYSDYKGICSPAYVILRKRLDIDEMFFKYYFKSRTFIRDLNKNLEGIRDGKMVSYKQFSEILLPIPSISDKKEQQKIADCLSSIDVLIKAAENKIEVLKAHKKGLMQQLFPAEGNTVPQCRFPKFQDAGEWIETPIYRIGKIFNGLYGKNSSDFGYGKRYITYKQVYSDTANDFDKCEKVFIGEKENQNPVIHGDILFTTSSEISNEVGISSVILEPLSETIYLNSFCFILRPYDINKLYPKFAKHLFRSQIYRNRINKLAQGAIRFNLSRNQFINLRLPLPNNLKEQQKIADCLSTVDDLIMAQSNRLETLKVHKKGLMQQLFPNLNVHKE